MSTVAIFFLFLFAALVLKLYERQNRDRLQVIQEALRDPNLDEATRRELAAELVPSRRRQPYGKFGPGKLVYAAGWISLCVGAGLCLESGGQEDGSFSMLFLGLALLSLPIVLREFDRGLHKG
ncbi:MAG: hypothetical protein ACO3RU_04220 [Planctomycetota bacterium]